MRLVEHRGKWAVRIDGKRLSTGLAATRDNYNPKIADGSSFAERTAREILSKHAKAISGELCGEIIDAYLADMPLRSNPKTPDASFICSANASKVFFGQHQPHEVTKEECRAYVAQMRKIDRSDGTIRKHLEILRAALNWHGKNTPAQFDLPAPPPPRNRWLTREEFKSVLVGASEYRHVTTFLHAAICTGARKEAILTMQWGTHVNFERRTLWPGFKAGGKNRAQPVPMTDACYKWLLHAYEASESPWVVEWAGHQVKDIKKGLKSAYERAGLADVKAPAHTIRHTAGAWMSIAGVPMLEISRRLGHASMLTTQKHYAHLHPDFMGVSTAALEISYVV